MSFIERFLEAMVRDWREIGAELMTLEIAAQKAGVALLFTKSPGGDWVIFKWNGSSVVGGELLAQSDRVEIALASARKRLEKAAPT
jgi:hypothetical protein